MYLPLQIPLFVFTNATTLQCGWVQFWTSPSLDVKTVTRCSHDMSPLLHLHVIQSGTNHWAPSKYVLAFSSWHETSKRQKNQTKSIKCSHEARPRKSRFLAIYRLPLSLKLRLINPSMSDRSNAPSLTNFLQMTFSLEITTQAPLIVTFKIGC